MSVLSLLSIIKNANMVKSIELPSRREIVTDDEIESLDDNIPTNTPMSLDTDDYEFVYSIDSDDAYKDLLSRLESDEDVVEYRKSLPRLRMKKYAFEEPSVVTISSENSISNIYESSDDDSIYDSSDGECLSAISDELPDDEISSNSSEQSEEESPVVGEYEFNLLDYDDFLRFVERHNWSDAPYYPVHNNKSQTNWNQIIKRVETTISTHYDYLTEQMRSFIYKINDLDDKNPTRVLWHVRNDTYFRGFCTRATNKWINCEDVGALTTSACKNFIIYSATRGYFDYSIKKFSRILIDFFDSEKRMPIEDDGYIYILACHYRAA